LVDKALSTLYNQSEMDDNLTPQEQSLVSEVAKVFEDRLSLILLSMHENKEFQYGTQALQISVQLSELENEDELFGVEKHKLISVLGSAVAEAIVYALRSVQQQP